MLTEEKKPTPEEETMNKERVSMTIEDAMKLAKRFSKELDEMGYEPDGSVSPSLRTIQIIGIRPKQLPIA